MRSTIPLSLRDRAIQAFSLIEIVLAVGVISFALVGILGLFPVALQTATSSQRETQAALIARSIFSDLESETGAKRYVFIGKDTTDISEAGSGKDSDRDKIPVNLTEGKKYYLAYDESGLPLSDKIGAGEYASGMAKAGFLAEVSVVAPTDPPGIGLTQVEVTVSAPGVAAAARRIPYPFVSVLNNGQTP
jgi:type II secretory pathway pseudopilin PulG